MYPTIACVIPTPGQGRPLKRCLNSIAPQVVPGDEVWVIGDTHGGSLPEVERLVSDYGPAFKYVPFDAGYHGWGHPQINQGRALAAADYLTYNDDDDVFTGDAFKAIREAAAELSEPRPLMFRFVAQFRLTLWDEKLIRQDHIGGHCFVPPNIKERLAPWTDRYQGDYDHIRGSVDLWPNKDADVVWREEVIAIARPEEPA